MIERAYRDVERLSLAIWNQDEAGPFATEPYEGSTLVPKGQPIPQPHEYLPNGTAKVLPLFHPATGQVRVKGVTSSANTVLHSWLTRELEAVLTTLLGRQARRAPRP